MTITTLPTRNPADLGAALYDARTPNANELAAVNVEKIKDRLIEVATEIGLSSGATAGSINAMRAAFTAGAYSSILRRIGSAYGSQRIGGGLGAPTVADDSTEGYLPGSWWVQGTAFDNPATLAFFVCIDASEGAAVWVQIGASVSPSDALPLASGTASAGASADFSRADHVHPSGSQAVAEIAITNGVTLAAGDAVALVAGRASKADGRAGSVVAGYIGQCLTGGTGDAGGTVLARVVVGGIAPASGLTAGSTVYLSTTAIGAVTTTAPSGLGAFSQIVGRAISSTSFALQIDAGALADWCSPLDISTNGIFYGRASSANLLSSGRITTNGIADLFPSSSRVATIDASGNAPLYVPEGAPGGTPCWFFVKATRADRLRIVHDAGMTGTAWSVLVVHFNSGTAVASLIGKTNSNLGEPFNFSTFNLDQVGFASEGFLSGDYTTARGWRVDSGGRGGTGVRATVYSQQSQISDAAGVAISNGTKDILIGNRDDLGAGYDGRVAAFAIWNRTLTAAEHVGLAKWARREWSL